ncbi:MAG: hypothetical protein ACXVAX_12380 [Pseudobdellovibrio sp.]
MKLYFEFEGNKLKGTECYSYHSAKFMLFKILDECMNTYKTRSKNKMLGNDEIIMQHKILSKLKLVLEAKH